MPPSLHALVVDDNPMNNEVLTVLLKEQGIEVTALESPRQLSETIDRLGEIAVLFLDLEFPNYDGFELIEELKVDPRLENVPVVAYSVHISEIDVARRLGFHSFIGKPLDIHRFRAQLAKILQNIPVWET